MTDRNLLDRMFYHRDGGVELQVFRGVYKYEPAAKGQLAKFRKKGVLTKRVREHCMQTLKHAATPAT